WCRRWSPWRNDRAFQLSAQSHSQHLPYLCSFTLRREGKLPLRRVLGQRMCHVCRTGNQTSRVCGRPWALRIGTFVTAVLSRGLSTRLGLSGPCLRVKELLKAVRSRTSQKLLRSRRKISKTG